MFKMGYFLEVPRNLSVALAQAVPLRSIDPVGELAAEVRAICREHDGVQLVVFPEIHLHGAADTATDTNAALRDAAEPIDGPRGRALGEIAREHGVWLVPGSVSERGEGGSVHNTMPVYGPDGERVAAYRKVFPWRPYETWDPGAEFVVADLPGLGRAGLSICYDSWFPEATRQLAWLGAEVVVNVVKTPGPDRAQELVLNRANAITNQVYVLSVNAAAPGGAGRSMVVGPEGDVRVESHDDRPTILADVVDLDQVARTRSAGTAGLNRMWDQMRPDDIAIDLPAYGGRIDPDRWRPPPAATD